MTMTLEGAVIQPSLTFDEEDESFRGGVNELVLGVVIDIRFPDAPDNQFCGFSDPPRASTAEVDVLVVQSSYRKPWICKHVIVTPDRASDVDNYSERWPKPAFKTIDGVTWDGNVGRADVRKLDGSWAVVGFLGGSTLAPFVIRWWPSPANLRDPATSGESPEFLEQGARILERFAGVELCVTEQGTVWLDLSKANSELVGEDRRPRALGGDLKIAGKRGRTVEVNFNPPVPLPESEPSLPQKNPPDAGDQTREDILTRLSLLEDKIEAIAGSVAQLAGRASEDSVLLGLSPTDHAVLGEKLRDYVNGEVRAAFNGHAHKESTGGFTLGPLEGTSHEPVEIDAMGEAQLSKQVKLG